VLVAIKYITPLPHVLANSELSSAFEGIAAALSSALEVTEFRRKLVVSAHTALEGLLKRAPAVRGAYFSFCDIGGQQVCAAVKGADVESSDGAVQVGVRVKNSVKVQTQVCGIR
jgi:hypothetical protein